MLALLGIVGKIIGMFYRLPLTNILGAEGMGLYHMIFPVYSFILAVLCGGLPAAISKNVSEYTASGDGVAARRTLWCSLIMVTVFGVVIAVLIFILKSRLANLQGNEKVSFCYVAIIPAMIFSGMISCFRGYFQGKQNLLPSGISQIIEQVVKVATGLFLAAVLTKKGVEYGVFGALIGISISELAALGYLVIRCLVGKKSDTLQKDVCVSEAESYAINSLMLEAAADAAVKEEDRRRVLNKGSFIKTIKSVYSIALPITLGALVLPVSQLVDSFLIVNLLVTHGESVETATALFGVMSGPVGSLLNMPSVITVALATSLLPKIAYNKRKGLDNSEAINKCVSVFMIVILPCVVLFLVAPETILKILYSRGLSEEELFIATSILRIESLDLITLGIIQITSAMLQGIGKAKIPVLNLVLGAVIKVAATVTLLPMFGIVGAAIANVAFYGVVCALDLLYAKKHSIGLLNHKKQAKIILCVLSFALVMSLYSALALLINEMIAFVGAFILASAAYIALLSKTKCILLREILL